MALPNTGITTTLVGTTLGVATRNVGNLCTHPSINKWSKWKPVRFNKDTGLTLANLQSVNFGLAPAPNNTDYQSIIGVKWAYNKPRGGSFNEFYRIGDFRNYNAGAPPIIILTNELIINRTLSSTHYYDIGISRGSTTTIGIEDFINEIGNMYIGAVIVRGGSTYLITAERTLGEGDGRITINTTIPPFNTNGGGILYNVITTASVPTITLLNNVSPPPLFSSVPIRDSDNDILNFTIIGGIGINITMSGIGISVSNISASSLYRPKRASIWQTGKEYSVGHLVQLVFGGAMYSCAVNHISSNFQDDFDNGYWSLSTGNQYFQTMGNLYFRLNLSNTTEQVQSFFVHNLTMSTNSTFFGMSFVTAITAYDDTTLQPLQSSITLLPGQSNQVIVGVNDFMNRNNGVVGAPVAGTRVTSVFNIRYNGEVIANDEFNIEAN